MITNVQEWLIIAGLLIIVDVLVLCRIAVKLSMDNKNKKRFKEQDKILLGYELSDKFKIKKKEAELKYFELKQSIQLDKTVKDKFENLIDINKIEKKYLKSLRSSFKIKKVESIVYLGLLGTERARLAIENAIVKETDSSIKIYMANVLADIKNKDSIPVIVSSLIGSNRFYKDKVNMLIADFGDDFNDYIPEIVKSNIIEMKELIVNFASVYFSENTKEYLINLIDSKKCEIKKFTILLEVVKKNLVQIVFIMINFRIKDGVNINLIFMVVIYAAIIKNHLKVSIEKKIILN